jgi:hypothetical protein
MTPAMADRMDDLLLGFALGLIVSGVLWNLAC